MRDNILIQVLVRFVVYLIIVWVASELLLRLLMMPASIFLVALALLVWKWR